MKALLKSRPDAVFAASDLMAAAQSEQFWKQICAFPGCSRGWF
jgi:DNA-binding LacI/PurR family transcriptional regulator